jgi:hypothetical protein
MTVGVQSAPISGRAALGVIVPLTERVLSKLGPPRALWIVLWGCLASVIYEVAYHVYHVPVYPGLAFSIGAAYANLFSLWAVPFLVHRVNALQPLIEELVGATAADPKTHPFRLVGSRIGPLLLLPVTAGGGTFDLLRHPSVVRIAAAALLSLGWLPGACVMWTILMIFLGLDRLGRQPLHLRSFHQDRSLGLAPLGQLALSAFTVLIAALVPITIATARDRQSVLFALAHLAAGVAAFFLSLYRLHEQLAAARARYLVQVRRLSAEAFAPVENGWSLDNLAAQSGRINAARALEQQVGTIQRWPVGETAIARIAAIATSVVTAMIVRIVTSKL